MTDLEKGESVTSLLALPTAAVKSPDREDSVKIELPLDVSLPGA
jgi:hypothetical protein